MTLPTLVRVVDDEGIRLNYSVLVCVTFSGRPVQSCARDWPDANDARMQISR